VCGGRFANALAEPVGVQHVADSVRHCQGSTARQGIPIGGDLWETVGYLAIGACALLTIGLCLL